MGRRGQTATVPEPGNGLKAPSSLRGWAGGLVVFALSLGVYIATLLPGVGWGDTAKLQYIAYV